MAIPKHDFFQFFFGIRSTIGMAIPEHDSTKVKDSNPSIKLRWSFHSTTFSFHFRSLLSHSNSNSNFSSTFSLFSHSTFSLHLLSTFALLSLSIFPQSLPILSVHCDSIFSTSHSTFSFHFLHFYLCFDATSSLYFLVTFFPLSTESLPLLFFLLHFLHFLPLFSDATFSLYFPITFFPFSHSIFSLYSPLSQYTHYLLPPLSLFFSLLLSSYSDWN